MATGRTADARHTRPSINVALVRRLVDTQFPRWAGLPLELPDPAGSDHVIHRLGEELSVRLPRHAGAIGQARKESGWLPRLAPHLPLATGLNAHVSHAAVNPRVAAQTTRQTTRQITAAFIG